MKKIGFSTILISCTFILLCFATSASSQQTQESKIASGGKSDIQVAETTYYVFRDGKFEEAVLTKDPEMIGGKDLMETLIKLNIQYPDKAKEKMIGGTVLISVVIDEQGNMEDAFVHEGIGGGCNDEALRAVRIMNKVGFEPGEIDGIPVTVKFDIPLTFVPK